MRAKVKSFIVKTIFVIITGFICFGFSKWAHNYNTRYQKAVKLSNIRTQCEADIEHIHLSKGSCSDLSFATEVNSIMPRIRANDLKIDKKRLKMIKHLLKLAEEKPLLPPSQSYDDDEKNRIFKL